jgi:hypothetical protein
MNHNGTSGNERLDALKKREAELRAQIAAERVKQQRREWREYERLKNIVGAAVLANAAESPDFDAVLKGVLKGAALVESEKKLLRGKGWI